MSITASSRRTPTPSTSASSSQMQNLKRPFALPTSPLPLPLPKPNPSPSPITHPSPDERDRALKRARFGANDAPGSESGTPREKRSGGLSKGAVWMADKLEEMENLYKNVLLSAALVVQFQAFSLRMKRKRLDVPIHLDRRLRVSWGNYEALRRQIQSYMNDAAQHAATPSSKPIPVPLPTPAPTMPLASSLASTAPPILPAASPIPLSAASMLSFNPPPTVTAPPVPDAPTQQQQQEIPLSTSFALDVSIPQTGPDMASAAFQQAFPQTQTLTQATGADGGIDLANMGMDELTALINGGNFDFTKLTGGDGSMDNGNLPNQMNLASGDLQTGSGDLQNDAGNLLAALSAQLDSQPQLQGQAQPQSQSQLQPEGQAQMGDQSSFPTQDNVDALLASLGNTTGDVDSSFDFNLANEINMDDLSQFVGLFGDQSQPGGSGDGGGGGDGILAVTNTSAPDLTNNPQVGTNDNSNSNSITGNGGTASTAPVQIKQEAPSMAPGLDSTGLQFDTGLEGLDLNVDPSLDTTGYGDMGPIDLDDFNFGGEGTLGMEGDEFESLMAQFN